MFTRFNKGDENNNGGYDGYDDWMAKKRKRPQLERNDIVEHGDKLITKKVRGLACCLACDKPRC